MSNLLSFYKLHPLVYVIADKPAKDNVTPEVPLVGTASYKTLLGWLADMDVDITRVRMYNQSDDPFGNILSKTSLNRAIELGQIRVVALGQKAATYLKKTGIRDYFLLFHPSGRNRLTNDKEYVSMVLDQCKLYIYNKGQIDENSNIIS